MEMEAAAAAFRVAAEVAAIAARACERTAELSRSIVRGGGICIECTESHSVEGGMLARSATAPLPSPFCESSCASLGAGARPTVGRATRLASKRARTAANGGSAGDGCAAHSEQSEPVTTPLQRTGGGRAAGWRAVRGRQSVPCIVAVLIPTLPGIPTSPVRWRWLEHRSQWCSS